MIDHPFHSALDIGRQIRAKKVSSVELTTFYLDRLQRFGGELGAVVTITAELALAQARQFDDELASGRSRGPLHGVPYGIKDVFSVKNYPTTWGSAIYRDRIIDHDAAVVVKLREAGCPLLAKLSMVEFAGSVGYRFATASLTGAGRTPWNIDHWSGGSSSGSGAAVAAGLAPFAIGTETWGSILCPSAFCGVTGLRSTSGRVSRDGAMALSWTMDKIGPLARDASDASAILEIISGPAGSDLLMRPESDASYTHPKHETGIRGMRIGVVHQDYGAGANMQPETDKVFQAALHDLESLGAVLVDIKLPDLPMDQAAMMIVQAEGASAFEDIARDAPSWAQVIDPEMRGGLIAGLATPAVDYIRALRIRGIAQAQLPTMFASCDLLAAPSYLQVAPPITANLDDYFVGTDGQISSMSNMLGLPAIGLPMGSGHGGLPLAMQLVAPPLAEGKLVAVGTAYQSATSWHTKTPPRYSTTGESHAGR